CGRGARVVGARGVEHCICGVGLQADADSRRRVAIIMSIRADLVLRDGRRVVARLGAAADDDALTTYYRQLALADDAPFFPMPRDENSLGRWLDRGGYREWDKNVHWLACAGCEGGAPEIVAHLFIRRTELPSIGLQGIGQCYLTVAAPYRASGLG